MANSVDKSERIELGYSSLETVKREGRVSGYWGKGLKVNFG